MHSHLPQNGWRKDSNEELHQQVWNINSKHQSRGFVVQKQELDHHGHGEHTLKVVVDWRRL